MKEHIGVSVKNKEQCEKLVEPPPYTSLIKDKKRKILWYNQTFSGHKSDHFSSLAVLCLLWKKPQKIQSTLLGLRSSAESASDGGERTSWGNKHFCRNIFHTLLPPIHLSGGVFFCLFVGRYKGTGGKWIKQKEKSEGVSRWVYVFMNWSCARNLFPGHPAWRVLIWWKVVPTEWTHTRTHRGQVPWQRWPGWTWKLLGHNGAPGCASLQSVSVSVSAGTGDVGHVNLLVCTVCRKTSNT